VPRSRQTTSKSLAQKAVAYDMPRVQVDGNDILAVYTASLEAVKRAREESCPTLVECLTYRLERHTTVDDPSKYRDESEVEEWEKRDPLPRFQKYLEGVDVLSAPAIEELEADIEKEIDEAVEEAETRDKDDDASAIFEHLQEAPPESLTRQREAFEARQTGDARG
jgi:TPP-dependent pyruvate/acetoin dehydrogenase alpha subunit